MSYRWTFGKDPLKLEKFRERSTTKYDMIDPWCNDRISEKALID